MIKNKILIGLAIMSTISFAACAAGKPSERLIERLAKVSKAGNFAFGHHDDTAYGHTWEYMAGRSDVKEVCGDYPGLMNWDLGLIEWQCDKELDGVPFNFIREEVKEQDERGGINAFSWHLRNPINKQDAWSTTAGNVVKECITTGTVANDTMKVWIARAADFIKSLKDKKGNPIPVVFRPWHEHTGSWFWWGYDHCSADEYKALWRMTRQIFDEKGVDNVVWAYSPDKDHVTDMASYLERYPGDAYVDIMGADVYHFDGEKGVPTYEERVKNVLSSATEAAEKHGKLVAFTETGSESLTMPNWWTEVLYKNIVKYPICYVCVWRNSNQNKKHFYAPYPGQQSELSFKKFFKEKKTLFSKDMKKIK